MQGGSTCEYLLISCTIVSVGDEGPWRREYGSSCCETKSHAGRSYGQSCVYGSLTASSADVVINAELALAPTDERLQLATNWIKSYEAQGTRVNAVLSEFLRLTATQQKAFFIVVVVVDTGFLQRFCIFKNKDSSSNIKQVRTAGAKWLTIKSKKRVFVSMTFLFCFFLSFFFFSFC